jgi:Domain of unknown function (DUF4268)
VDEPKTSTRDSWYYLAAGITGAEFQTAFTRGGLAVQLVSNDTDPTVNMPPKALHNQTGEFEEALGEEAVWDEMTDRKGTRIFVASPFGDVTDTDQWPAMIDWLMDQHARFRRAIQAIGGLGSLA